MAPEEVAQTIERLREPARARVERTSLNHVAKSVGMTSDMLLRFLAGSMVRPATRTRLARWLDETERIADERAARCMAMVLEVVADLEERRRMKAARAVLEALSAQFKQGAGPTPLWLQMLIESLNRVR